MIQKLKAKFIGLTMASVMLLLSLTVTAMNLLNFQNITDEADRTVEYLSTLDDSAFEKHFDKNAPPSKPNIDTDFKTPPNMSPETPYESRYFKVFLDENNNVYDTYMGKIISVDTKQADEYAHEAIDREEKTGFIDQFRYRIDKDKDGTTVTFLDCGRKFQTFASFLFISSSIAFWVTHLVLIVVFILAGRIVKPYAENYKKQKQFITDAGHEIKTPLTIINANLDMLEADPDDKDCINDIRQQTRRLTDLTKGLIFLAKTEEADNDITKVKIPLSDIISETVNSFNALSKQQNKNIKADIQPMVSMKANQQMIEQLVYILTDNALKYSPEGGEISIKMSKHGRIINLSIINKTTEKVTNAQAQKLFERFYRSDSSRNSETGGYGIGLSVAKAIVETHNGKIIASTPDGKSFKITCMFTA